MHVVGINFIVTILGDVAHCGYSLQIINARSGDQLYRYYRYPVL
jgi:hypothetical protein